MKLPTLSELLKKLGVYTVGRVNNKLVNIFTTAQDDQ